MTGVERANGQRPTGLMNLFHPALRSASQPDPAQFDFDLSGALDSVVLVHASVPEDSFTAHALGHEREGSGVVIDEDGLVLTIGYLIVEATEATLTCPDGRAAVADVIAYDHETGFGMLRAREARGLRAIGIGSSGSGEIGDEVVVASYGGLDHSISARLVDRREFAGSWEYLLDEALFTAPVHPFWGGTALIDGRGEMVGVGSLYVENSLGGDEAYPGNMFVPIDLLGPIFDDMVSFGKVRRRSRPWLGLYAVEAERRLFITGVAPDGPADAAGIEPGDIILSLDGTPVNTLPGMYRKLWSAGTPGVELRLTVLRDDDVLNVRVYSGDRYEFLRLPHRH